jgi:hypothetical protein
VGGRRDILQLLTGEDLSFAHQTIQISLSIQPFILSRDFIHSNLAPALAGDPGRMLFDADERRNETHVDGDQVDLGVTVLSGLGGGHLFSPHIRRFASHPCGIKFTPMCRRILSR